MRIHIGRSQYFLVEEAVFVSLFWLIVPFWEVFPAGLVNGTVRLIQSRNDLIEKSNDLLQFLESRRAAEAESDCAHPNFERDSHSP